MANNDVTDLLERLVALQMWNMGASQQSIAKSLSKSKGDINNMLKGVPKGQD